MRPAGTHRDQRGAGLGCQADQLLHLSGGLRPHHAGRPGLVDKAQVLGVCVQRGGIVADVRAPELALYQHLYAIIVSFLPLLGRPGQRDIAQIHVFLRADGAVELGQEARCRYLEVICADLQALETRSHRSCRWSRSKCCHWRQGAGGPDHYLFGHWVVDRAADEPLGYVQVVDPGLLSLRDGGARRRRSVAWASDSSMNLRAPVGQTSTQRGSSSQHPEDERSRCISGRC